ncbi:MAG: serine/threonine protein kinase, partial [Deltaproteobacteria bacterium]
MTVARPTGGGGPRGPGPGAVLGRYALCEEVGAGGMASVWRAVDRQLRRVVAVKVLHPHLAKRADVVARFHREARAVAALDHPHVLRVFDVGGGDGDEPPYLVTEWIAGGSLDAFARARGPLLGEIVASVGAILCDALAVAHAAGIVHRDVKPANVLVDDGGRLVLGDFGVARVREGDSLVTATGALLGTPAFMAPEQALGDPVDARTDLYSLGATLYFLATGALPYAGPPARVMADLARGGPLPPLARNPAMGGDLARAIERLMCRDPAGRFPDARAAGAALAAVARAGGLDDPAAEWAAYFEDPAGYEDRRRDGIADCCLAAAEAARRQGAAARALALADRALSLRPGDARALRLVGAIGGQRRRRLVAAAAAAVAAIGVAAFAWWPRGGRPATRGAAAAGAEPASPAAAAPGAWAGAARLVADASDGPATADEDVVGPSASRAGASVADASAERSRAGVPAARAPARGGAGTAGARAGPRSDATATRRAASPTAGGGARPA